MAASETAAAGCGGGGGGGGGAGAGTGAGAGAKRLAADDGAGCAAAVAASAASFDGNAAADAASAAEAATDGCAQSYSFSAMRVLWRVVRPPGAVTSTSKLPPTLATEIFHGPPGPFAVLTLARLLVLASASSQHVATARRMQTVAEMPGSWSPGVLRLGISASGPGGSSDPGRLALAVYTRSVQRRACGGAVNRIPTR